MRLAPGWAVRAGLLAVLAAPACAGAQEIGREAALRLRFPPLEFDPPEPSTHILSNGVRVLHLENRALPLVNVHARFRGGFAHFPRAYYAAATALPSLLRSGGTSALPPDSLDALLERYAISTSVGGGGGSSFVSLNTVSRHLDVALELLGEILKTPRFDLAMVEVWRGQELESVRRRRDDPGRLAFSEFNRLMFGDHPIGWEMEAADLEPADLSRKQLEWVYRRVFCPDNLILGVTGDVSWRELSPRLERLVAGWGACAEPLQRPRAPTIRREPGVFLIERPLEQSTVVMAHATDVRQRDDDEFYAARIGNAILGGGGFSSRLTARLRTERGYAYSASSLWTIHVDHEGIVGALTQTRSGTTVAAVRMILGTMEEMTEAPPSRDEVSQVVDQIVSGFVFNFESPTEIVARRMLLMAEGLPEDWLERYLEGIQLVTPADIEEVFRRHLRPEEMVILVLGNTSAMDESLERLGPVTVLEVEGGA